MKVDINWLLKTRHLTMYGNNYFGYCCISENGISKPRSIRIFGKRFNISPWLQNLLKHKERF